MSEIIIENILNTSLILFGLFIIVPRLIEDPPMWVKAAIVIPGLLSLIASVISSITLVWMR